MPIFITQGRYESAAIKGMLAKPENREEENRRLFERAGGRLIAWYVTLGEYDWLCVAEAPDAQTHLSAALVAAGSGAITDMKTCIAFTGEQAKQAFTTAGQAASQFRGAGQSS